MPRHERDPERATGRGRVLPALGPAGLPARPRAGGGAAPPGRHPARPAGRLRAGPGAPGGAGAGRPARGPAHALRARHRPAAAAAVGAAGAGDRLRDAGAGRGRGRPAGGRASAPRAGRRAAAARDPSARCRRHRASVPGRLCSAAWTSTRWRCSPRTWRPCWQGARPGGTRRCSMPTMPCGRPSSWRARPAGRAGCSGAS